MNARHAPKRTVTCWTNHWQVSFPRFKKEGLRAATQPVPPDRFRPRIGVALAQGYRPFFLSAMEAFGLLTRIQLPKSVVITMTVQSGQAAQPRNAQEQPDFAGQLREVLSDWVIGKTTAAETGVMCGQLVSLAKAEIADRDAGHCSDTHSITTSAHSGTLVTEHRETALCCIAHAALQKILHKSRFDDSSPLVDFFRFDLGEEWAAFIESAKDLAGLILDTEASVTDFDMDEDKERLKSLRKPFLSLLAKAQAMVD